MEITIFAKKRMNKDGKAFTNYVTTLTRTDGTTQTMQVKFREDCGSPKAEDCPMNIVFNREDGNVAKRRYTRDDTGELCTAYTLWLKSWARGAAYEDHSLDEFA